MGKVGYTLVKSPVHDRANAERETLTFTPMYNLESSINLNAHVFGLWEELHFLFGLSYDMT